MCSQVSLKDACWVDVRRIMVGHDWKFTGNPYKVLQYFEILKEKGWVFPPCEVSPNPTGNFWLNNGRHRFFAAVLNEWRKVPVKF